jgi:hypothetical protein
VTYHAGMGLYAAGELGLEPHGPFVRCDGCGREQAGTTRKGDSKSWLRGGNAPPKWLLVRVERDDGVYRRDYCPRCRHGVRS